MAGHGIRTATNEYWFLTSDATAVDPYEGIRYATLQSLVTWEKLGAPRRVLLLDTCFSGSAIGRSARGGEVISQRDVDEMLKESRGGIYVLSASKHDEYAQERSGHGVFTAALLEGLSGKADNPPFGDGSGYIEIEELQWFVKWLVHERTDGKQTPTVPEVKGGENFRLASVKDRSTSEDEEADDR